ncbi:MAG: DUF4089 domain-containing protein [Pseudomonadota bacterium]
MSRPFDADAFLTAASATVGLDVPQEYREGVQQFLKIAAEMAEIVEAVPLDEQEAGLAPIYRPPGADR